MTRVFNNKKKQNLYAQGARSNFSPKIFRDNKTLALGWNGLYESLICPVLGSLNNYVEKKGRVGGQRNVYVQ